MLQNNASKLLLAIMESRHDSENAERILYNMRPKELVNSTLRLSPVPVGRSSVLHMVANHLLSIFKCLVGAQVEVIKKAYMQGEIEVEHTDDDENGEEEHAASPRNVGHNIYILAHQVTHANMHLHTLSLRSLCQMSGLYHRLTFSTPCASV